MSRFKIGIALGFGLGYAVATGKAQELVGRLRGGGGSGGDGAQSASERYFPPSTAGDAGVPPGGVSVTV
jgi:hypothetical protein